MKKVKMMLAAMLLLITIVKAQPPQPPKPPTPEERLKRVSEKLDKDLKLSAAQKEKVMAAYKTFFAAIEKNKPKGKDGKPLPPPPPPPPVSKEIADKLSAERDAKVKQSLTAEQYKKYVELEKTMRPQRPGKPGENAPPPPEPKN